MPDDCLICDRIALIRQKANKYFVAETETGFIVLGDHQFFRGYTLLLCKEHKHELHELDPDFRKLFLWEMSEVAAAVFYAFTPQKMNYELLGNTDHHMHWHLFPRHDDDPSPLKPVWSIPREVAKAPEQVPSEGDLDELRMSLLNALKKSKVQIISKPEKL